MDILKSRRNAKLTLRPSTKNVMYPYKKAKDVTKMVKYNFN